jgi:hypothetical protein
VHLTRAVVGVAEPASDQNSSPASSHVVSGGEYVEVVEGSPENLSSHSPTCPFLGFPPHLHFRGRDKGQQGNQRGGWVKVDHGRREDSKCQHKLKSEVL